MKKTSILFIACAALAVLSSRSARADQMTAAWYFLTPGVNRNVIDADMKAIADMGFTHVLFPAIVTQKHAMSTTVDPPTADYLANLSHAIELARKHGLKIGLTGFLLSADGMWRGQIMPPSRTKWAESYFKALTPVIQLAQSTHAELFCIASEMESMKNESAVWSDMLARTRKLYSGKIGFNMNWWFEKKAHDFIVNDMPWMDNLDFIGVSSYFTLTDKNNPTVAELSAAWSNDRHGQPVVSEMNALKKRFPKQQIYVWEIGYRDIDGANTDPANYTTKGESDTQEQADCFEAFLKRFPDMGIDGFAVWAQSPGFSAAPPPKTAYEFIGKPAGDVIKKFLKKPPVKKSAAPLSIKNDSLLLTVSPTGRFSIARVGDNSSFVNSAAPAFLSGPITVSIEESVTDAPWGRGARVTVSDANTNRVAFTLYENIPFLFAKTFFGNPTAAPLVIQRSKTFLLPLALNIPKKRLVTQGTGFLSTPDKKPGGYVYMAVADRDTNQGVVTAWLTQDRGSGVILAEKSAGGAALTAQLDYGNLRIQPGSVANGETLLIGRFDDARLGLEQFAALVAKNYAIRLRPIMDGYCTWYASFCGGACEQTNLKKLTASGRNLLQPYGLDFIQIDDMWQDGLRRNGPAKNFTAHNKMWPYPAGMKAAAADITKKGFVPGIWWMPFAGDHLAPSFKDRADWFVKNDKGQPYETPWGGTSLDMSAPAAREYVAKLASTLAKDWGYKYFKMDGLYTGMAIQQQYVNHEYKWDGMGDAKFFDPNKTNVEIFRDGLRLVREAAGDDVFFLGCTTSQNNRTMGGSFGLVDAMRIGEDNGPALNEKQTDLLAGPRSGSNRYFLHGRVWWNDPDPVYIRPTIPIQHARLIASWVGLTGQMMTFSEWLPDMPADRVHILQRILPNHGILTRPVDYFQSVIPRIWTLTDTKGPVRRDILGLFNWDPKKEAVIRYDPVKAGLPPAAQYVGFDFWANQFLPPFKTIDFKVPAGSARIIAVRPASPNPILISTNRHITQGIVDVRNETWANNALTGASALIASEPYELRIIVPAGENSWLLDQATAADPAIKVTQTQTATEIRVTLTSEKNTDVAWNLKFRKGRVDAK